MVKVKAQSKWVRSSARKIRRVINLVRGKAVSEAIALLKFMPQKGARVLEKAVKSAAANAKNNFKLGDQSLVISECYVDEAAVMKRFRAGPRGRVAPRKKRNSHVTVFVSPLERNA